MTDKQFMLCVSEVDNYSDRDTYVSDLSLSSIWDDAEDAPIPDSRIDALGQIWDACHRSVKQIASAAGLSQRKLAERFCIPYRTVENWGSGVNVPSAYVLLMMQECLGLLHR